MPLAKHAATPKVALKNNSLANKPQVLSSDALQAGGREQPSRGCKRKREEMQGGVQEDGYDPYSPSPQKTSDLKFNLVWWNVQSKNNPDHASKGSGNVAIWVAKKIVRFFNIGCDAVFLMEVTKNHDELVGHVSSNSKYDVKHLFFSNDDKNGQIGRCSYLFFYRSECKFENIELIGPKKRVRRPALHFLHGGRDYYGMHLTAESNKSKDEILFFMEHAKNQEAFLFGDVNHDVTSKKYLDARRYGDEDLRFKPIRMGEIKDICKGTHKNGAILDGAYTNEPYAAIIYDPFPSYKFDSNPDKSGGRPPDHRPIGLKIY